MDVGGSFFVVSPLRMVQKRAFSAVTAGGTSSSGESIPAGNRDSKRPRYTTPVSVDSSTSAERSESANLVQRPKMVNAEVQTDFTLLNSIVVSALINAKPAAPIRPPKPQRPTRPAAPPPVVVQPLGQPVRKIRSSPRLAALPSAVSVSNVGNVNDRQLTSFSSVYRGSTIDVPSVGQKKDRPRLRHTRTAPVDGDDEAPRPLRRVESSRHLGRVPTVEVSSPKEPKHVGFGAVEVFYFHLSQSHDTVPSSGGPPLGMELVHHTVSQFDSPADFQRERGLDRTAFDLSLTTNGSNPKRAKRGGSTSQISFANSWDPLNVTAAANYKHRDKKTRRQIVLTQNIPLDKQVTDDCAQITHWRSINSGCSCRGGVCRPSTCQCAADGVSCQIDKPGFPCSCSAGGCGNPEGRKEFDTDAVHTHFVETIARLKSAERNERALSEIAVSALTNLCPQLTTPPHPTCSRLPESSTLPDPLLVPRPFVVTPMRDPRVHSFISTQFHTPQLRQSSSVTEIPATPDNLLVGSPLNVTRRIKMSATALGEVTQLKLPVASTSEPNNETIEAQAMELDDDEATADRTLVAAEQTDVLGQVPVKVFVTLPSVNLARVESQELSDGSTAFLSSSRSISAATTTTDETSRANSMEIPIQACD